MRTLLVLFLIPLAFAAVLPRYYVEDVQTAAPSSSLLDKIREEYGKTKDEIKHDLDAAKDKLGQVEHQIKDDADKLQQKVVDVENSLKDVLDKIK